MPFTFEDAEKLLTTYNEGDFHLKHSRTVSDVMRWYASDLGHEDEAETWAVVGLLHDLDYEQFPDEHCVKGQELMRAAGVPEEIIHACITHGWGCVEADLPKPETLMEKVLYATDELTGLIGAVAIMRPSKSVDDLPVKSVRKKFKDKRFAAGCSRDVIQAGADMLGWELDELFEKTILAMRSSSVVD